MLQEDEILRLEGISKAYPGVLALDHVDFSLQKGEVHALVGENGAGKSTLIKCISGAIRPDAGKIYLEGQEFVSIGPKDTIAHGIVTVYQELNLIPSLSVAENVFVGKRSGRGLFQRKKQEQACREILKELHIDIDAAATVSELSVAHRQLVEIVRAISGNARILILDEPTSSLTVHETQFLFDTIRALKQRGVTIIYISHIFEETFALADRITVMRDGKHIKTLRTAQTNKAQLIKLMVGREIGDSYPPRHNPVGEPVLEVEHLSAPGVSDVSFTLHKGEILGFAGLVGAGRTELMHAIYGANARSSGTVRIHGKPVRIKSPNDGIRHGLGMIPEDRKLEGVFLRASVEENISASNLRNLTRYGVMRDKKARRVAADFQEKLRIKTPTLGQQVQNLSGGNQQKVAVAKALAPKPEILIFDEPTRGIDVGAKQEIYKLMNELVAQGHSILMVSSEMAELMGMADRILVMSNHHLSGELQRPQFNQETILQLASDEPQKAG